MPPKATGRAADPPIPAKDSDIKEALLKIKRFKTRQQYVMSLEEQDEKDDDEINDLNTGRRALEKTKQQLFKSLNKVIIRQRAYEQRTRRPEQHEALTDEQRHAARMSLNEVHNTKATIEHVEGAKSNPSDLPGAIASLANLCLTRKDKGPEGPWCPTRKDEEGKATQMGPSKSKC